MKLANFLVFLGLCEAKMTEPFRVKTWLDAKYLQDVSFVKKFRETPDEPVEDFIKKNGKQMSMTASKPLSESCT